MEKINRGRRDKAANEKKSENASCTSLHCSQGLLIRNVSLHSCLVKLMSSGTSFALGITCPVDLHTCRLLNFSVMLLLGYTDIHPGCLEISLGDSEGNKNI